MDRAYETNQASGPPAPPSPAILGYPQEGATPTVPGAWWFYMVTEELRAAIVAGGIVPSATAVNQLQAAITNIANGAASAAITGYATQAWVTANFATPAFASNSSNQTSGTLPQARLPASFTVTGTITAASFNVSSDARLKEDIKPIPAGALDRLDLYRGVTYRRKGQSLVRAGFVAGDFGNARPEGVRMDADGHLELDVVATIAELKEALHEERDVRRRLEARVAALENLP